MDKSYFINVPVTADMKAQVKRLADEHDQSEAAIVRQALREFLQDQPPTVIRPKKGKAKKLSAKFSSSWTARAMSWQTAESVRTCMVFA